MNLNGLTRRELARLTGEKPFRIAYLYQNDYLPVLRPSPGPGTPVLFHPDAVEVIRNRMRIRRGIGLSGSRGWKTDTKGDGDT